MILYEEDFLSVLKRFQIDEKDVCIIGSSVLTYKGYRPNGDLDFAIKPNSRKILISTYYDKLEVLPSGTINFVGYDNVQSLCNRYSAIGISDDLLLSDRYSIPYKNTRIARPEIEIAKKIIRNSEKDKRDLVSITNSIDWKEIAQLAYIDAPRIAKKSLSIKRRIKNYIIGGGRRVFKIFNKLVK